MQVVRFGKVWLKYVDKDVRLKSSLVYDIHTL